MYLWSADTYLCMRARVSEGAHTHTYARRTAQVAPQPARRRVLQYPQQYPPRECACAAPAVPPVHARARAYKNVSFASEPIQPPIVPVKPFVSRELRSTTRARERTDSAAARPRRAFPAARDCGGDGRTARRGR